MPRFDRHCHCRDAWHLRPTESSREGVLEERSQHLVHKDAVILN